MKFTTGIASTPSGREREIVADEDVRIEVISEGAGPLVCNPALARTRFGGLRRSRLGDRESRLSSSTPAAARHGREQRADERSHPSRFRPRRGGGDRACGRWPRGRRRARIRQLGRAHDAADHPRLVRGVIILAAAAKTYPKALSEAVTKCAELTLADSERLEYLRSTFFAPGHDASVWLKGWYPEVNASQFDAGRATRQEEWWGAGGAPLLDLQAALDPFKPRETANELREEFGERVTIAVIPDASHALIPEQPAAVVAAIIAWIRTLAR